MSHISKEKVEQFKIKIRKLIEAHSKAVGKPIYDQLMFEINIISSQMTPYDFNKLKEAVSYAWEASGRVKNKEHWTQASEQSWYVFESNVSRNLS